jgi:cytochrome P450
VVNVSIAGTHTTSATTTLLFYHLLHQPELLSRCVAEIDSALPPLAPDAAAYSARAAEASLPYLKQCIKENFRITPVFTMPLARRVMDPSGLTLDGHHFPQGVSSLFYYHHFALRRSTR